MKLSDYHAMLREGPSIVSNRYGVILHHCTGRSITQRLGHVGRPRRSDWLVIPLMTDEHAHPTGIHGGVKTWEAKHGTEAELIDKLIERTGIDVWTLARELGE